jgi:hypothetical protein
LASAERRIASSNRAFVLISDLLPLEVYVKVNGCPKKRRRSFMKDVNILPVFVKFEVFAQRESH